MPKLLFPPASKDYVLSFQFSAWYPKFAKYSIKSTILRPLSCDFKEYLQAEGVFIPEGADNALVDAYSELAIYFNQGILRPVESTLSDDEGADISDNDDVVPPIYNFPHVNRHIRECIEEYGAVFPKLNFSSPKVRTLLV